VENTTVVEVDDANQVNLLIQWGEDQRRTECSRSHLMMSLYVESKNLSSGITTLGKLTLADLAGSEKVSKNGLEGEKSMSKCFSALGDVVTALNNGAKHIPYQTHPVSNSTAEVVFPYSYFFLFC
jgi:hypothetical protein